MAELPLVDATALGRILRVTPKEIYELIQRSILKREPGRLFSVERSVGAYMAYLREAAAAENIRIAP